MYGQPTSALSAASHQRGLPLHVFPWRTSMRQAGLARNAGYLVRPDGHVALADHEASAMTLQAYLEERAWAKRCDRCAALMRQAVRST